ncbi:polyketide synthase [Trichoderma austrokoningii]
MALPQFKTEPIAVVGSSCRFPGGANSPSKLWQLLKDPRDVLVKIPPSRFNPDGFYNANGEHHGSTNVLHSYLLEEDHREFDHNFFNIHPKEAESMDPQQRMLLESVYECVEAAGYSIQELKGSQTAIFVGQMTQDYSDLMLRDVDSAPQYAATGISRAILSNRVSYFFDWKGPSSTIDTACSSSLVALHHAVQTLRSGESSLAVAAGVNLILGPDPYILESKLHMLSPTGRSRMWDADADGYARGEGFASILLKTLSQAIKDGDHIECLIRETGVNQDGRTSGITMPSSVSQTALIKSTYTRAGLDYNKKEDRCQYFEAHGTGTMAGDPIEARAVRDAFFGVEDEEDSASAAAESDEPLYVGSVKTVIGHLEGTAGLAGLLKASLAVQHGIIPPNMLFNKLNPAISPFYSHLCIPTRARPWPKLPPGVPRRASVNSFGFGGTNAHAILEHWQPGDHDGASQVPCGPFTLSANTEKAVRARAKLLSAAIASGQVSDLSNLAWTLQTRRTQFPHRIYISASKQEELVKKLNDVANQSASTPTRAIHVTEDLPARILGIFTGQGAQWPSMGRRLYEKPNMLRQTIDDLEKALSNLPVPPSWSLSGELVASAEDSRIHEAAISQPLCTALQIALVDLLYASGITFSAVVGHSSGEISAAYAAGYLKAADAIAIAYYRGVFTHLAGGPNGQKGKMMAVGMNFEQALFFCKEAQFAGRIQVAAGNSRSSVTLSGDEDAIEEAKQLLDQQQTFARVLKVEKAYHSHHMQRCAQVYLEALQKLDIQIQTNQLKCKWYSSVHGSNGRCVDNTDAFKASYWVDNMVKPVLFSQAIDRAVVEEHCHDIAMEIGPHPALKAPALETLKNLTGLDLPYSGVLKRGEDDMESFSDALGFIWSNFHTPTPIVDFAGFRRACLGDEAGKSITLKGIPPYPWDHDSKLWKESRKSRNYRSRKNPMHELLGYATTHGNNSEVIWRNVMKIKEMEWLRGHVFQGQVLFPAAGYVSMAYEASIRLVAGDTEVRLVELEDLMIHRAITLEDESSGTEVTFTIRVKSQNSDQITAEYSCYSCKVDGGSELPDSTNFTGRAIIHLGTPHMDSLPARVTPKLPMKPVSVSRLYSYMEEVGLRYTGEFMVEGVERRLNTSTVKLQRLDNSRTKLHPATLDAAFHGIFTALAFPGDGQLWTPYLPTNIRRVRINPAALDAPISTIETTSDLVADCYLTNANSKTICGDIQLQSLTCSSFTKATPQNDRKLFAKTIQYLSDEEVDYGDICERLAYFYLRRLRKEISPEEIPRMDEHFQIQIDWILNYLLPKIEAGNHPRIKKEWMAKYPGKVELQMISALGEVQPSILRGQLPALQVMMQKDMLTRLHLITVTSQLAHRYPRMKVLEIGAGLAGHCHSYTYTDISAGFFEAAQERFREYSSLMEWAVLDIERDPCEQGFEKHSFDSLAQTLTHCRTLLKPGGFMILNEVTNDGWWLGRGDGRLYHPTVDESRWHKELLATGFSGRYLASLIVSQAVDDRISLLRNPLSSKQNLPRVEHLCILGGESNEVRGLVQKIEPLFQNIVSTVTIINTLEEVGEVMPGSAVLILSELDRPAFQQMTPQKFHGMQLILQDAKYVLWITQKCRDDNPMSNMGSQMALVFSPHARSILNVPKAEVLLLQQQFSASSDAETLLGTIIAESIVQNSRGIIWIHDADALIAQIIPNVAGGRGLDVFLSTSSETNSQPDSNQAFIHPYATERDARNIIPADIQSFVNLGKFSSVLHRIVESSQSINQVAVYDESAIYVNFTKKEMADIASRHILSLSDDHHQSIITLDQVTAIPSLPETPTAMLSWNSSESVSLKINPVDPNDLFSANKTYLLVGLASELGLSLCDWMVTHGARNIVVTSRNPGRVDAEVLKHLRHKGANISIFALDISDKEGLLKIYKEVCETMPPIAGVANAAMVLNDKLFTNMTLADFEVALKPKVTGTQNLDEIFYSTPLEFFICFSSLTCVMGNGGQSNYAAANMYMHSLVRQRKKRGVSASIIDIAFLLGVGFVSRNLEQYEDHLKKVGYMRMSEPEFHTVFAEAIVAGKSISTEDPEIIIGIGQAANAPWYTNPRFATYVPHESTTESSDRQQVQSSDSVQGRLAAAGSGEGALTVLQIACAEKLAMILQVHADSIDHAAPLLKLGIDSLVAVEIRSWFLKEVNVDMPVLKILSGASLADICQDALVMLPSTLISSAKEDLTPSDTATKATGHQKPTVAMTSRENQLSVPSTTIASSSDREGDSSTELSTVSPKPSSVSEELLEDSYLRVGEMTPGQSRLYFLHVYLEDKTTYNVTMSGKLSGPLSIGNFSNALDALSEKHEGLRTSFYLDNSSGKAMQGVNRRSSIVLEHVNIPGGSNAKIQGSLDDMKRSKFDLNAGEWMKIRVLSLSQSDHRIFFTFHHIALDGVGWSIFLKDLNDAYAGKGVRTPRQQAIDLSQKMQRETASGEFEADLQFWRDTYDGIPEPMPLFPISKVQCRQLLKSYDTETLDLILQKPLVHQIKQASADLQVTSFHFYLSAIAAFVSKCLNIDDFAIADMATIGYFTNLLPLRFRTNASESFGDLAVRTRNITLAALSHSRISRSGDQNPLTMPLGECEIQWTSTHDARNPYDLIIDISEIAEGTIISFTTQSYLYSTADTDLLLKWYTHTLKEFAADTSKLALDCYLTSSADIQRAISVGRGSRIDIEWDAPTLAHRIIEMAELSPTSMAIKDGYGRQLTYSEMMRRVQQFAEGLSNLAPGSYVGILLEPAANTICSLVAIMVLEGRLAAIISDCKPAAIICQNETLELAHKLAMAVEGTLITLLNTSDVQTAATAGNSTINCLAQPHSPGFAIYTSGSTGTPKGVLLTHHSILNQIWGISKIFEIQKETVLQQSSFGFDLSLEQVFIALANGGTLIVASKEARGNAPEIANLIVSENITYTVFVPSEYLHLLHYTSSILRTCSSWKYAFSGGEKVTAQLRRGFKRLNLPNLRLINLYGPAEASLSCTRYEIPYKTDETTTASPAGFVMPNYTVIVVDQNGKPLPLGFPGEICIAGAGNSVGYVNRPQETASKFTPHVSPIEDINLGWNTLYHTGDKGRMLENGLLEFIGRLDGDSQVKIRGMRIELEEIAKAIVDASQGAIDDASVSLRDSDLLVAYVVFSDGFAGDTNLALEHLKNSLPLPSYMCPTHIIAIDEMPRNPNGKKDRSKIDALAIPDALEVKPQTGDLSDFEKEVAAVWRDVLPNSMKLSQFGPDTNFFFVGGNSLLLLKLQAELDMALGSSLTLSELFQASTIRDMASRIRAVSGKTLNHHIDWNKEIRSLCDGLSRSAFTKPKSISSSKSGRSVILTGATGFLGRNMLKFLVDDGRVSEIHCIAIRPDVNGQPRHVDVSSSKIIEYSGNLADHDLGLSSEQLESIASRANVIIHNGADVSFMKTYQSLRRSNVLSTRRLAEIAAAASIPFHFVSTASVAHLHPGEHLAEVAIETQNDLPVDGQQGYAISKWISEALLEYLADNHALQSCVHRPTSIIGDGAPDTDIIASLCTYSEILGSVPQLSGAINGSLDFVDVQQVAKDIATQALASTHEDPLPKASYINHCSEKKVPVPNLREYMQKTKGKSFDELELNVWLQKAREAGLNELICEYLKMLVSKKEPLHLPALGKGKV